MKYTTPLRGEISKSGYLGLNMWVFFFQNNIANFIHMQSLEKKLREFKAASVKMLILTDNFLYVLIL